MSALWLPLLRRLTERFPGWGLWKNAEDALQGHGDFDSTAEEGAWDGITDEFARWAAASGLGPVAACRHVKGALFLAALDEAGSKIFELDVNSRKYFRGWTVFQPGQLLPVMELDARGFRRVRPGAEGVILLTQNGLKWGGRQNSEGLARKRVAEFLSSDLEGVLEAAKLFRPADKALVRAAESAARHDWDRAAMLTVEARAVLGALAAPSILASRVRAKRVKKQCPLLVTIFSDGRTVRGNTDAWIKRVAGQGEVHDLGALDR
ncbi:hypothetical protein BH20ACT23_BH20ACT23_23550 [soil metagenome]